MRTVHLLVLEPASPREKLGWHTEVPNPGVAAFTGFAVQAKLIRFMSAGASTLHTPSLSVLIQVTRRGSKG